LKRSAATNGGIAKQYRKSSGIRLRPGGCFLIRAVYRDVMPSAPGHAKADEHPLREYRRRKGLQQAQLARKCGLSASMISQIELGYVEPSLSVTYRIHLVTGVSLRRMARFHASLKNAAC
jgi:DNA-binding XRE family transcriptional regulator